MVGSVIQVSTMHKSRSIVQVIIISASLRNLSHDLELIIQTSSETSANMLSSLSLQAIHEKS
jgi:hypothetical protein